MPSDQGQSPRLGQPTPVESTLIQMFSGDEIPEAAWEGMPIYRRDTQTLQIYNGNAWEDVVGGVAGQLTFVGPDVPVAQHSGDIWFDSGHDNAMYVAASADADEIVAGEWEPVGTAPPPVTSTTHIYHQDTPPGAGDDPPPTDNDFWFETPGNKQYYYLSAAPGTHWVGVRDTGIQQAQDDADTAQTTADLAQSAADAAQSAAVDAAIAAAAANTAAVNAMSAAAAAQATADGAISTYYQASAPWANGATDHADDAGDMWFDTDDNQAYRWNDVTKVWEVIEDNSIAVALAAAQNAQLTADGKITHFISDTPPVAEGFGDIWSQPAAGGGFIRWYWDDTLTVPDWVAVPVGTADIAPSAVHGTHLSVDALDGKVITGAVVRTSAIADQGIHLDEKGLRAYPPEGGTPFLNVDPVAGLVIVAGQGTFRTLTVDGPGAGSQLGGTTIFPSGAHVTLTGGANPPTSPPTAEASFLTLQYGVPSNAWTDRAGWSALITSDTSDYVTFNKVLKCVEKWGNVENGSGTVDVSSAAFTDYSSGGSAISGRRADDTGDAIFVLYKATGTGLWTFRQYRASDMVNLVTTMLNFPAVVDTTAGAKTPVIGFDQTPGEAYPVLVGQARANGKIRISRLSTSGVPGPFVDTNYTLAQNLLAVGFDEGDGAAIPFDFAAGDGDVYYFIGTDNQVRFYQPLYAGVNLNLGFDTGALGGADSVIGFYWRDSKFASMSGTGLNRNYTAMANGDNPTSTNLRKWITQTKARTANGYETPQSPAVMVQLKKRQQIAITGDALLASPGANDPTGVKFYIGQGATDPSADPLQMSAFLSQPSAGTNKWTYNVLPAIPGTTHPPSGNNFPNSAPSILDTQQGGFSVNNLGNGSVGTATFRDSILALGIPPAGAMMMWPTATAPAGWALCNGAALNTGLYPALFAAIGYTFGGSGTSFNLPNLAGKFPFGAGTTSPSSTVRALGTSSGVDERVFSSQYLPPHTHGMRHDHGIPTGDAVGASGQQVARGNTATGIGNRTTTAASVSNTDSGPTSGDWANNPFPIMPPYLALNFIIKL